MSSGSIRQRVLRTVRLLPQAVKIGVLETEIKQSGNKPDEPKIKPDKNLQASPQKTTPEINKTQSAPALDLEIVAQISKLQDSLANEQLRNMELTEAKNKLESEINGVKLDYESRKRAIEADAASNAKKAADEARAKGYDEGFSKGHDEGLSKAREEVENEYLEKFSGLVKIIDTVGKNLDENFASLVSLNQPRLIRVWTEMLRRMLQRQVELNSDTIDDVLMDLLSRLSDKNQIVIYVSPDDLKHLEGEIDTKFQEVLRGVKRLELKPDPSVEQGSCIVETGLGVYDARWRTQMGQIEGLVDNLFQQIVKDEK